MKQNNKKTEDYRKKRLLLFLQYLAIKSQFVEKITRRNIKLRAYHKFQTITITQNYQENNFFKFLNQC